MGKKWRRKAQMPKGNGAMFGKNVKLRSTSSRKKTTKFFVAQAFHPGNGPNNLRW